MSSVDQKPVFLALCGAAGSGKSTLARRLCEKARKAGLALAPLDPDAAFGSFERELLRASGADPLDRDSADFKRIARPLRYQALGSLAQSILDSGQSVLLVAPMSQECKTGSIFSWAFELAPDSPFAALWLHAPEKIRKERVAKRARPEDLWKLKNWEQYDQTQYNPIRDGADQRLLLAKDEGFTGKDSEAQEAFDLLIAPFLPKESPRA